MGQMPQPLVVTTFQQSWRSTWGALMAEHLRSVGMEPEGFL